MVRWAPIVAEDLIEQVKRLGKETRKRIRERLVAVWSVARATRLAGVRLVLRLRGGRPHTMRIIEPPILWIFEDLVRVADLEIVEIVCGSCGTGSSTAYLPKALLCVLFLRRRESSGKSVGMGLQRLFLVRLANCGVWSVHCCGGVEGQCILWSGVASRGISRTS